MTPASPPPRQRPTHMSKQFRPLDALIYSAYRWAERRRRARLFRSQQRTTPALADLALDIARRVYGPTVTLRVEHETDYDSGDPSVLFYLRVPKGSREERQRQWEAFIHEWCARPPEEDEPFPTMMREYGPAVPPENGGQPR